MAAIFFDFETTDIRPIGQVVNYSLILVDEQLKILRELNGLIKVSRTQLPSPGAILANRVNILEHQRLAMDSEAAAMRRIHDFIAEAMGPQRNQVALIGFNSSRFDVEHFRTGMIRNGLDPYFYGRLVYKDLFHAAQKLAISHSDFPRAPRESGKDKNKISLSLENIAQRLGLLTGKQEHESRCDVLHTINLAAAFRDRFGLDVLKWDAYEVASLHSKGDKEVLCWSLQPCKKVGSPERANRSPMCLLDFNKRSALWVNLDDFKAGKGRDSIFFFTLNKGQLISGGPIESEEYRELALKARQEFAQVNVENFFERSTSCDIEQDIYRLPFGDIAALGRAIWAGDSSPIRESSNRDLKVLWTRYRYANSPALSPEQEETFKQYAIHRYGGGMQVSKNAARAEKRGDSPMHQTYLSLVQELEEAYAKNIPEDRPLLDALRQYYEESDIVRLAGMELKRIVTIPKNLEALSPAPAARAVEVIPNISVQP